MKIKNNNNLIAPFIVALSLTACGGGGGSEESPDLTLPPVNKSPTVNLSSINAKEGSQVSMKAAASDDASGLSYSWSVSAMAGLELIDVNSETLLFNAPFTNDDSIDISVSVTVTDAGGLTATQSAVVTVENDIPVVALSDELSALEKETISLVASIEGGAEIASYNWSVTGLQGAIISSDDNLASLTLPGVSSDSELSATLTVVDSDGDVASASMSVAVSQIFEPLIINGLVTDSPIANSEVSVFVGERQVETVADENGLYTVDLKIDDDEMQALIKIQGMGVGEQSHAGLISIIGMASDLLTQSGGDSILKSDENFAVNVTNITTAEYALMMDANEGAAITTGDVFSSLKAELNLFEVLEVAALIKVAIDYADDPEVALPEDITNTLELVSSTSNLDAFEESVPDGLVEDALSDILSDETLLEVVQFDVPEALHNVSPSFGYRIEMWQFYGTGLGSHDSHEFTWTSDKNKVLGEYVVAPTVIDYGGIETEFGFMSFDSELTALSFELTVVSSKYDIVEYAVRQDINRQYIDKDGLAEYGIEDPSGVYTETFYYTAYLPSAKKQFPSVSGYSAVMPVSLIDTYSDETGSIRLQDDKFQFNADGTGHAQHSDYDFDWLLSGDNLIITQELPEGGSIITTYNVFADGIGLWPISRNESNSDNNDVTSLGRVVSESALWTNENVPGVYGYPTWDDDPLNSFWFELHENGDADTISTADDDDNGVLTEEEIYTMYGTWRIEDGKLIITRIRNQNTGESSSEQRVEDGGEWAQYHERVWDLVSVTGNTFGLLHKHNFTYGKIYPEYYPEDYSYIYIDSRNMERLEKAPVDLSGLQGKSVSLKGVSTSVPKVTLQKQMNFEREFDNR